MQVAQAQAMSKIEGDNQIEAMIVIRAAQYALQEPAFANLYENGAL